MSPELRCKGTVVPSFTMRTSYPPLTFSIGDTCEYMDIQLCTFDIPLILLLKLICFTFEKFYIHVYIHCSIHICSVFDHFGYRAPDLNAWNHLTWYSEDWTLQWLQALHAEMNPHHIRGHEFCHREEDQSTLAITRAIMDRVGATIATQVVATSTTPSASGTLTTPAPSKSVAPGKSIPTSYQFVTTDSDGDSNGIPQILSEDETTPPEPSNQPPVPKLVLKRKLKRKVPKRRVRTKPLSRLLK